MCATSRSTPNVERDGLNTVGQAGPRHAGVLGDDLAQHAEQLTRHLLGAGEPPARIGVDRAAQQPAERIVLREHGIVLGQAVDVAAVAGAQVQRQRRQRAADGVDVGGDRRARSCTISGAW